MTTAPKLLNSFWYYLRKKLNNKTQTAEEIDTYKSKMEFDMDNEGT